MGVKIMKVLIDKDKCLEINTKVQEFINDQHTLYILNLYKELGGKNLDCLNMDKIRAYVVSTFNIANGGFHNSVAVLMFDGTYYESIPKELSYEEYFESKINWLYFI